MGFFDKLKQGLAKTKEVFSFTKVDENLLDELEEKLIIADVGMEATEKDNRWIKNKNKERKYKGIRRSKNALRDEISNIFEDIN